MRAIEPYTLTTLESGIRVSLYNAVTEEQVDALIKYMEDFVVEETKSKAE